jgi:serine/threonine-protein kinase PknG
VRGCIGYGGQGWVYLAHDWNLGGDPVAVKGLRDTADAVARAASAAERRNLIALKHPDIVDIRNFVVHPGPASEGGGEYIVLEFLDGESLDQKRRAAAGRVLPVAEAIAYVLAVLPALAYLHEASRAYVDFKPANVMQVGRRIKLVDLGAVQYIGPPGPGHPAAAPVITTGYAAPEVAAGGPASIGSDLFAVGRTLAVLTADFDYQGLHSLSLPGPEEVAVFGRYESFYRFLVRATEPEPEHRFTSVAQFAEQLAAVLREVVAFDSVSEPVPGGRPLRDRPPSVPSRLFTAEQGTTRADPLAAWEPAAAALALPRPRADDGDPLADFLAGGSGADIDVALAQLRGAPGGSATVTLYSVLADIDRGDFGEASATLAKAMTRDPRDWRFVWYSGLIDLARGKPEDAWQSFAWIRDVLPGELAPKLALAVTAESLDRVAAAENDQTRSQQARSLAEHYHTSVWRTDGTFVAAVFGVARLNAARPGADQVARAVRVLESVPGTLGHHRTAAVAALRLRLARPGLDESALRDAAKRLSALDLGAARHLQMRTLLWEAAAAWLRSGGRPAGAAPVLDVALTPEAVGTALEHDYLRLRRFATTRRARVELVKRAHAARPRTRL